MAQLQDTVINGTLSLVGGGGKIEDVLEYLRNILSKFNTEYVF